MLLKHAALTCSTENNADKFYRELLGLNKSKPKTLSADLAQAIFNLDADLQIIDYTNENVHFEIFVTSRIDHPSGQIAHQCLEVDDLPGFIRKCRIMGVEVALIAKGDKTLTFIKDYDGNLFEIKGK